MQASCGSLSVSLETPGWTTFAYGEFLDTLAAGGTWSFRLTANPAHHIRLPQDAPGTRTKRAAHITPAARCSGCSNVRRRQASRHPSSPPTAN
ncbi:type I-E CRISPR-associated protein Cas6/Cse3/CasE [Streptomyces rimosus]|uniref:type I-E CRISPR-associated protein Cas6/Cse3/CasE n=1 Tax=Streptomyces rimosus TaxID=1927 RepID=UPI0037D6AE35